MLGPGSDDDDDDDLNESPKGDTNSSDEDDFYSTEYWYEYEYVCWSGGTVVHGMEFLDTYTRMFLPTVGPKIREEESEWSTTHLEMPDTTNMVRYVRSDISQAEKEYKGKINNTNNQFGDYDLDYSNVNTREW